MDRVRDALLLVADDVDRTRLGTVADVRARGQRMVYRRRMAAAATASVVALAAVLAVLLGSGVLRAAPVPVQPRPHPTPSPTDVASVTGGGCGHGLGCPEGPGPFRVVFDSGRGGDQLSARLRLPAGWRIVEESGNAVLLGPRDPGQSKMDQGLTMVWPVRPVTGSGGAQAAAEQLARLTGSADSAPRQVVVGGRTGWQVTLALPPAGTGQCLDPRSGLYAGEHYVDVNGSDVQHCATLLDLVASAQGVASTPDPVGTEGGPPIEVTLLDGFGIRTVGGAGILAIFRWDHDVTAASPGRKLLESLQFGAFARPGCGQDMPPDCPAGVASYDAAGDPVQTETGIRAWDSKASFDVPGPWDVVSDDAHGTVALTDRTGLTGAELLWEPLVPGTPPHALTDAQAWAARYRGDPRLSTTQPVATTIGGRPAWRLDMSVRTGKAPYQDGSCSGSPVYYSVALACAAMSGGTANAYFLESDVKTRVWFVQAGKGRVLMIVVWGRHTHAGQAPQLPKALATAQTMLSGMSFTLG